MKRAPGRIYGETTDENGLPLDGTDYEAHMKAADVTRAAYTKQFEAGRRSLFDLLDSENEYFQAKMSYANAQSQTFLMIGTRISRI